jgi:isopentenyl-diphosphate delta-isomerase
VPDPRDITARKGDHIALCRDGDVGFDRKTTLFDEVELVHCALPERAWDEVDLDTELVGHRLKAPLVIAAMTGGTPAAEAINRDLAAAAESWGIGFALGSQRPMLLGRSDAGYRVRDVAPSTLILGNIGVVQARETPTSRLRELVDTCGADALCVHLNPAMELVQPGGDRDFRGGLETIGRLVAELGVPVIAKETGCGLSRRVAEALVAVGVRAVDVSGAGGTSWVAVEMHRAKGGERRLGAAFRDWGIPTAASVAQLADLPLEIVATGGVASGLDVAKALVLGATVGGVARPLLQAQAEGQGALHQAIAGILAELRVALLLSGVGSPRESRTAGVVLGERLRRWVPPGTSLARRTA